MPQEPGSASRSTADRVLRTGAALVGVGAVATIATLLPLVLDADPLPLVFYLLCFLAPLGLGLILVGLWLRARDRRARLAR